MDALKFWAVAIAFGLFLWFLSPDTDSSDDVQAILEAEVNEQGKTLESSPLNAPEPMRFKTATVPVTTKRGNLKLVLGFAYNQEQHRAGLMHYRVWPRNMHGLLFLFREEDQYSMWMRNTHLPLDILFIDRGGKIVHIAYNAQPLSEEPIKAPEAVLGILEIPAGSAEKWNIAKGDRLRLKYFRSALRSG